jgi:hypothetical protein
LDIIKIAFLYWHTAFQGTVLKMERKLNEGLILRDKFLAHKIVILSNKGYITLFINKFLSSGKILNLFF